jgi:hypothetical protein
VPSDKGNRQFVRLPINTVVVEEKMEVQPNENSATLFSTKAERINVQSSTNMDNLNPDC